MTVQVLLVDDDPLVIAGLRMLLAGDTGLEVVGEASDGGDLPAAVAAVRPDVVLLDVRMPGLDGVSALRELHATPAPHPAVVILTTFPTESVVLDALRAGAAGFLVKHAAPTDIIAAVHAAAAGEATVSPAVLRQLIGHVAERAAASTGDRLGDLTAREREVAFAVADGLANAEIAQRLYLSVGSVKAHISSALAKLGLDNRVQLAIAAHESRGV
jgi:DNA-binding NarL/FixJ family response regulator